MKKIIIPILALIVFFSCNKEKTNENSISSKNLEISEFLDCNNFDVSDIQFHDDYVKVESDILIPRQALLNMISNEYKSDTYFYNAFQESNAVESRQYANLLGTLVAMNNVQNIKFYIDNSVSQIPNIGANWVSAIVSACSQWTAILDCKITFTRVYTHAEANLSFYADNAGSPLPTAMQNMNTTTYVAQACFPFNGNIGRFISINNDNYSYNLSQLTMGMKHEIGHTLGLRHNNVSSGNGNDACGHYYTNPSLIAGTPQNDPNSIMVAAINTNTFTSFDLTAIKYLYPENYNTPVITNIINITADGNVRLQISPPTGQLPYRAIVQRLNLAGSVMQSTEFLTPGNTTNFDVPCPNGIWKYRIFYTNYGTWGNVSNEYVVCQGLCELKRKNSNKCLDASNCGTVNGTNVQVWDDNNLPCQRWIVTLESDGYYELKMQNSPTRNLDVSNCGTANGTNVQLWNDLNNNCQRWKITLESDGFFELKPKVAPTKNLDIASCLTNVQIYDDLSNECQRWQITVF